jgi:hypothetical protein
MAVAAKAFDPWRPLAELRAAGLKPKLPVVVTTDLGVKRRKFGDGSLVIVHRPGERMPVALLDGIDVRLVLDRCDTAGAVYELMAARGVRPTSCSIWCRCAGHLVGAVWPCERVASLCEWEAA